MKNAFALVASVLIIFSIAIPAAAAPKATNGVEVTISSNSFVRIGSSLSMESGETVTINCTYSPRNADIDFGLITPENKFRYLPGDSGSCKYAVEINKTGILK